MSSRTGGAQSRARSPARAPAERRRWPRRGPLATRRSPGQALGRDPRAAASGSSPRLAALHSSPRSASRTSVTRWKYRSISRVSTVRSRGRSMSMIALIRPGRGDITTTRVDRNTASAIEWVTNMTVVAGALPDLEQLEVHPLAGHLVERPERLVHQQDRRVERRAPGRSRRAAACRPTAATGSGRRSRPARRGAGCSAARLVRSARGVPLISRGSSTLPWTVRQSNRTGAWKTMP